MPCCSILLCFFFINIKCCFSLLWTFTTHWATNKQNKKCPKNSTATLTIFHWAEPNVRFRFGAECCRTFELHILIMIGLKSKSRVRWFLYHAESVQQYTLAHYFPILCEKEYVWFTYTNTWKWIIKKRGKHMKHLLPLQYELGFLSDKTFMSNFHIAFWQVASWQNMVSKDKSKCSWLDSLWGKIFHLYDMWKVFHLNQHFERL